MRSHSENVAEGLHTTSNIISRLCSPATRTTNRLANTGDLIPFATSDVHDFPGQRLEQEQDTAIKSTQRSLALATDRYRLGIYPDLKVITAQTTLFSNQEIAVNLRIRPIVASVQLIEAVGGG